VEKAVVAGNKYCCCGGVKILRRVQQDNHRIGIGYVDVYVCDECNRLSEFLVPNKKHIGKETNGDEW
jgi:hypothetical protein